MFQTSVVGALAAGFPGEIYKGGPMRARPGNINSSGTGNLVGYAYTKVAGTTDNLCIVGGTPTVEDTPFFGILANPKEYALRGTTSGGTLAPSLALPQYSPGDFVYMTTGIFVMLSTAANEGDFVDFVIATGALLARAVTVANPAGGNANIPGAKVMFNSIPAAGLAVIELNG